MKRVPEVSLFMLFFAGPMAIISYFMIPGQLRIRDLKDRGTSVMAVCEERLHRDGLSVTRINCVFSPAEGQVSRATVHPPKIPPRVGQKFSVVFDPERPQVVESFDYVHGRRYGDLVFQAISNLLVLVAFGIAANAFFG